MSGVGTTARRTPLLVSLGMNKPVARAWSARRTLAFVMLTCGGFWAVVLASILR